MCIQISRTSEHTADLSKEEETVRECSEPSIVITFKPHITPSEDSTIKEAGACSDSNCICGDCCASILFKGL